MRMSNKMLTSLSLLSLVACGGPEVPEASEAGTEQVATVGSFLRAERPVPGQYLVTLKDGVAGEVEALASALARQHGGEVFEVYAHALRGFAVRMPEAAARALSRHPSVALVEEDGEFQAETVQSGMGWGLDRIDQRTLPLSGTFSYTRTGAGVNAYIVATGIRQTHEEFRPGRAKPGYDAVTPGGTASDCQGIGTHVAGVVGGTRYGVAKGVTLWAVRALNCQGSGTISAVVASVDWVRANHVKPAVANIPMGGSASTTLDSAVSNLINSGVPVVVPAGSSTADACNTSPARVPAAITVAATTETDARAAYSNYGSCVDIFAPGSATAAWYTSDTAYQTLSGTTVASAFVTGVVALYLQSNPSAAPATVTSAILGNATTGVVQNAGTGTSNRLLYTNY